MENTITFEQLLIDAVEQPGRILEAYRMFHNYSIGNQLLAMWQCSFRGIPLGPINTFKGWQSLNRQVRKGEKAIALVMPVTCKTKTKDENGEEVQAGFTKFIHRNNWFVLSQTDGDAQLPLQPVRPFDIDKALAALEIERVQFDMLDGNCQGYAVAKTIAVSPIAALPLKTTFHEMAHVLLGHTDKSRLDDSDATPRNLCEVEAESVALICCASLELPGVEFCRGYIQSWLRGAATIPEKSAQKIFKVANQILKAGQVAPVDPQTEMF